MPLAAFAAADIELSAAATEPAAGTATRGSLSTILQQSSRHRAAQERAKGQVDGYVFMDERLSENE